MFQIFKQPCATLTCFIFSLNIQKLSDRLVLYVIGAEGSQIIQVFLRKQSVLYCAESSNGTPNTFLYIAGKKIFKFVFFNNPYPTNFP